MARIDDHGKKPAHPDEPTRRNFFKAAGAGIALLAATNLGIGSFTRTANAQKDEYVQIEGQNVRIAKLDRPLDVLDKETQRYRTGLGAGETFRSDGSYGLSVVVPGEVSFLVTLNDKSEKGKENGLDINYPKERDSPNTPENLRGGRGASLNSFVELVKKTTGQDVKRVQIVLEQGTFDYQGNQAKYYTAYVLPIDAQGNKTTSRGPGKYLVFEASYFYYNGGVKAGADSDSDGKTILVELDAPGTIARR